MAGYERLDADLYDGQYAADAPDVAFYVSQARAAGSPVLELGCGTGRVLIPVAEAGIHITGVDVSSAMLAVARQKVARLEPGTAERISLLQADMMDFSFDQRFGLAMIPFRAFLHLDTPQAQRRALINIRRHLSPGGLLVFNVFDPSITVMGSYLGNAAGMMKRAGSFLHPSTHNNVVIWDSRRYELDEQTVDQLRVYEEVDSNGTVVSRRHVSMKLRMIYRWEAHYLLQNCGYDVEALYGDFQGGPFRHGKEQIWICRRSEREPL